MKSRKRKILLIYIVLVFAVSAFWAAVFKFLCPRFMVGGVIFVAIITSIILAIVMSNCFIKTDEENKN